MNDAKVVIGWWYALEIVKRTLPDINEQALMMAKLAQYISDAIWHEPIFMAYVKDCKRHGIQRHN